MNVHIATFTILCKLTSTGMFPSYKGSMLRGAFGYSLRRAVCVTKNSDCADCLLEGTCPFPFLFMGKIKQVSEKFSNIFIPPYCIEPPETRKDMYEAGEILAFNIILFSYAVDYLPYFIHAFSIMGERGLGTGRTHGQGTFIIDDVLCDEVSIFNAAEKKLLPVKPNFIETPLYTTNLINDYEQIIKVCFETPLRFKRNNHFASEISFNQLILLVIRRAKTLAILHGDNFYIDNFSSCIGDSLQISTVKYDVQWTDWTRYSAKQETTMLFGGLVGTIEYHGNIHPFIPFLEFAKKVHLGKQTSFGLGKVSYQVY